MDIDREHVQAIVFGTVVQQNLHPNCLVPGGLSVKDTQFCDFAEQHPPSHCHEYISVRACKIAPVHALNSHNSANKEMESSWATECLEGRGPGQMLRRDWVIEQTAWYTLFGRMIDLPMTRCLFYSKY